MDAHPSYHIDYVHHVNYVRAPCASDVGVICECIYPFSHMWGDEAVITYMIRVRCVLRGPSYHTTSQSKSVRNIYTTKLSLLLATYDLHMRLHTWLTSRKLQEHSKDPVCICMYRLCKYCTKNTPNTRTTISLIGVFWRHWNVTWEFLLQMISYGIVTITIGTHIVAFQSCKFSLH